MNLWFDLKYAWRLLGKSPGQSLLCVAVIALSVAMALLAYTTARSVFLRPLGFPGSEHWYSVQLAVDAKSVALPYIDAYTYQQIRDRNRAVDYLGALSIRPAVLSEGLASTRLRGVAITPKLLAATQVKPHLGRLFAVTDDQIDAPPIVILSFDAWQTYFASDRAIVGKQTRIDSQAATIIGVTPKGFAPFRTTQSFEVWMPLRLPRLEKPGDSNVPLATITDVPTPSDSMVVLSPFIVATDQPTRDAALREIQSAVDEVNRSFPTLFNAERHAELIVAHRWSVHQGLPVLVMMAFFAVSVLLIGCVNVSMVFVTRFFERSRELALRAALGATRARLLRQCLLETVFVVLPGMITAYGLVVLVMHWQTDSYNFAFSTTGNGLPPDLPRLEFSDAIGAVLIATVVWLLSTLLPAWRIANQDAISALGSYGKGAVAPAAGKIVRVLVGIQVLVSSLVLVICANIVFAIKTEVSKPSGLKTSRVMMSTQPTTFTPRYAQATERLRYWDELTVAIKANIPGAEVAYAATAAPNVPFSVPISIPNREGKTIRDKLSLPTTAVSDRYFDVLGLRVLSGRTFDETDDASGQFAVIDEIAAKRYWPNGDAVGKPIQLNPDTNGQWHTIIGVVSSVTRPYGHEIGLIYQSLHEVAPSAFELVVRLPSKQLDSRPALRAAAFTVDRDLPLHNLQTLDAYLQAVDFAVNSMMAEPLTVVALLTAMMAAAGLFGLISRSVSGRTQEVGIRRALGATQWQATGMFLRHGMLYLACGIAGSAFGILITNLMNVAFTNVMDRVLPITTGVFILMTFVIAIASYLPTRRAVALEPGDALRYE